MQKSLKVILLIHAFVLLFIFRVIGQDENVFLHPDKFYKKFLPHFKIKRSPVDIAYIKSYPNYLSFTTRLLLPKIYFDLNPIGSNGVGENASSKFRTNVNTIVGFAGSYRFVTAGFAIGIKSNAGNTSGYVHTKYRTATIKYNTSKYMLQFKFMKLKGLTDINESNNQDSTKRYVTRDDITMKEFHFEGIYNFSWKKYSYIAPLDFMERQVKSRVGFMVKAGIYNTQLFSDSNLLSMRQRLYFEDFNSINRMNSYAIKLAPGLGINLVFLRRFYLSTAVFTPFNLYFNRLFIFYEDLVRKESSLQLTLDGMASIGYQSKRFYAGLRYQAESKRAVLKFISMTSVYSYIGLDVGYRFNTPKIVKKVYKKTMPPGL